MCYGSYILQRQRLKFVLLEEVVKVLFQHFKDQTGVVLVSETLVSTHKVVFVSIFLGETRQYAHFDLTLTSIRGMVLQDLDGHDLIGALFPAFGDLAERPTAKELQHFILVVQG